MNSPSRWRRRRRRHRSRVRLAAGLGVAFVLALGGAGIAFVSQGGLSLPGGAEPPRQAAGDPSGTEPLRADATPTTSIEETRKEDEEEDPTSAHNIGVWYDAEDRRWAIINQDLAPMAQGTSFDVHVLSGGGSTFVHQATAENTVEDGTYLNDPLTNANPDVAPSVIQNWNPGGFGGTYNDHPIGVRYDADARQWVIFNEDGERMPEGADFNVTVVPLGEPEFVQRATSGNVTANRTYIDDPLVNGDPTAILFAIPRQREG